MNAKHNCNLVNEQQLTYVYRSMPCTEYGGCNRLSTRLIYGEDRYMIS